jgi:hypothetical protein
MKFNIDIGGGHIDIESFYRFRKILITPGPNKIQFKYIVSLFVL